MEMTGTDVVFLALCSLCAGVLWWRLGRFTGAPGDRNGRWRWDVSSRVRSLVRHLRVFSAETVGGQEAEFIDDRPVDFSPALPWIARGLLCLTYVSVLYLWYAAKMS